MDARTLGPTTSSAAALASNFDFERSTDAQYQRKANHVWSVRDRPGRARVVTEHIALSCPRSRPAGEQVAENSRTLWDMISAGGPLVIPILLCSFVLVAVVFERTLSLRRGRVVPRVFVERFLLQIGEGAIDKHEALERCEQNGSLIARVFEAAVWKWGKPAVEIEQAVLDEGERVANEMRRYLRVINGVSTVCPLFGLLGTVLGMMESFEVISKGAAMGRAELLAGGIGSALLSTAAGLTVAIPALILVPVARGSG